MIVRIAAFTVSVLIVISVAGCQPESSSRTDQDPAHRSRAVQRIHLVLDRQEQAIQSGSLAALDSLWSGAPDVLVFEQGNVDTTWAAYRDHHLGPELEALQNLRYRHEDAEVRAGSDLAVATGRYRLTARYQGRAVKSKGLFTTVFERRDGDWVIVHTHLSRPPSE